MSLNGLALPPDNIVATCCDKKVVRGRHDRMMRLSVRGMSDRLKLLSAMFRVKDTEKAKRAVHSCLVWSLLSSYCFSGNLVTMEIPYKRKKMRKAPSCCSAVIRNEAGIPMYFGSSETTALEEMAFMYMFMPVCAPKKIMKIPAVLAFWTVKNKTVPRLMKIIEMESSFRTL